MKVPAGCPLSSRQLQILKLLGNGRTYRAAAKELGLQPSTVRTHVSVALQRLGLPSTSQAVIYCFRAGWLSFPQGERHVTPEQEVYLHAFDLHLRAKTDDERAATRQVMGRALQAVVGKEEEPFRDVAHRDLIKLLVAAIVGDERCMSNNSMKSGKRSDV